MFTRIPPGMTMFDTVLGHCGLTWTTRGVDRLVLAAPGIEAVANALQRHDLGRTPTQANIPSRPIMKRPPPPVSRVVRRIQAHLQGRPDRMTDIAVDLHGVTEFACQVYRALRRVPPGKLVTYAELARRAGRPGAARAIGRAMATNPVPVLVPCHRVVPTRGSRSGSLIGKLGGYSAGDGPVTKARLLHAEGIVLDPQMQAGLDHLSRVDPVLRRIIKRAGPYAPLFRTPTDPYTSLVLAIINQQLSVKAGATIARRVRELTPGSDLPAPAEMLQLREEQLRGAGLSRMKVSFIRDLAAQVRDGRLDLVGLQRLPDAEAMSVLTAVRGIGRWSAEVFLIFQLGRLDILPVDDVGLRNAVAKAYGLANAPTAAELLERGERWRPFRSLASWYLWWNLDQ